jgi:cellulose synthase/poly-beta-1,6-N-acetylglucosamine synthase-like glycosyltransferase
MYQLIAVLSILNFGRTLVMLLGSNLYDIQQIIKQRHQSKRKYQPLVTIIIPAYNEEVGVIRTVQSVVAAAYNNKQIIVVNDGSTDRTRARLRAYQRKNPGSITVVNQANAGKAEAINRAVRGWTKGKLVMVLDADSILHPLAITNMVSHFRDRRVIAAASNVKIIPTRSLLGVAQRLEYLISYRMKRALTVFNVEYIIGGVGSTFRKSVLLKAGLYDSDTMTEDIDLTVKLIRICGNKYYRIHYAADSLAYTEHVLKFKSLVRQRFRWKYGRFQTLLKNQAMFFSSSRKYDKRLTWYQFPHAIVGELVLLIEPLLVGYILYVVLRYADVVSLLSVYVIVTSFIFLILLGEETEAFVTKLGLSLVLPFVYFLMYVLVAIEFIALAKSIWRSKQLLSKKRTASSWEHVERAGGAVVL